MVNVHRCRFDDDTEFVSGASGNDIQIKKSRMIGACAEQGSTGKSGKFETTMTLTTTSKSFSLEINRIDWSQKIDNSHLNDLSTATGRCLAYYGRLKDMPGGKLYKLEVPYANVEVTDKENEAKVVTLDMKKANSKRQKTSASAKQATRSPFQWFVKPHATFGPFGKKTGSFEKIDSVCDAECSTLQLTFESVGAAQQFVSAVSGESVATDGATAIEAGQPKHELQSSTVVFSGMDPSVEQRFKKIIESYGGRVTSGVSGKTTHLVRGANAGQTKVNKAVELNTKKNLCIKIVTEKEFEKIIEG